MRRELLAISAGVLAVTLGLSWLFTMDTEATAAPALGAGPTPGSSARAQAASRPVSGTPLDALDDEEELVEHVPSTLVVVSLRASETGVPILFKTAELQPETYWPLPGEAPLPDGPIGDGLQELLSDESSLSERDWLDDAVASGLLEVDPAEDPWAGVLALEVERRLARQAWDDRYADALRDLEPGRMLSQRALVGRPDVAAVVELADELIDAVPDSAAAEYGRLYLLDALQSAGAAGEARELALDMLRHTDDALVAGQAVALLAKASTDHLIPLADLDALEALTASFPESIPSSNVAAYALDQALRRGDEKRAQDWTAYLEDILARHCTPGRHDIECITHRDSLTEALGMLRLRDPADARTWQEGLELAAFMCSDTHEPASRRVEGDARWDGTWSWTWRRPSGFTRCIEQEVDAAPVPEESSLAVRLRVIDSRD